MGKFSLLLIAALALQLGVGVAQAREHQATKIAAVDAADLSKEARATLALIKKGGPFPYQPVVEVRFSVEGLNFCTAVT